MPSEEQAGGPSAGPVDPRRDRLTAAQRDARADVLAQATSAAATGPGDAGTLPAVLGGSVVAVLLVDRRDGTVTFANRAAIALAGDIGLPVGLDAWAAAAGLTDASGGALDGADAPLSRITRGLPVDGEPVRLPGVHPAAGADPELLSITGLPLDRDPAPPGADQHAHRDLSLVVLLPLDGGGPAGAPVARDTDEELRRLQEQAIQATEVCFTIADARRPDNPLVWVNPAFTAVTGYPADRAIGFNCRFLQGPDTDPDAVTAVREAVAAGRQETVTLLNYRADGSTFWNQLTLTPIFDGAGELASFVGVQHDVSTQVRLEHQREAALQAERQARQTAETARRRLQLMSEASATLTGTLDVDDLMQRIAELCVPTLADSVFIARLGSDDVVTSTVLRHRDGLDDELSRLGRRVTGRPLTPHSPAADSLRSGGATVVPDVSAADARARYPDSAVHQLIDQLAIGSLVALPLQARDATLGVLVLTSARTGAFDRDAVELLSDLAGRAGLALDNARLYQGQRSVAEALQRALLPTLPDLPDVQAAARYESASAAAAVGGDFYDLLPLPDGSIGISIGDVAGHDVDAAATMGQLRGLLRASAHDATRPDPADVLARVDELMDVLSVPGLATLTHVHAHRPTGGKDRWRLEVANAGHPPLVLRHPDGTVHLLDDVHGLILGVDATTTRASATVWAPRGSTLVAYTDGLIERHDQYLDQGIDRLLATLTAQPDDADPADLCDVLMRLADTPSDDVAVICVRLH
ncbi:SpoIIE family protein phosphatase [Modestobacter sp. VKM Ac-2986]|uniref:SpoIIE family protein phosphatase n=1 Tax=Modestobacter sp. VKM Ac-2986 TaxID=3004140 RepID=UPI0022AA852F|nr:SpoIIE family protein phosphatase [Modestobacter sp. VKM Ac-2986]MCZ2827277.1 SpoIIE family protein phosphatase [Modestobacter sp. VKM Ac-2986]